MKKIVITANRIGAQVFELLNSGQFALLEDIDFPLGRERNRKLGYGKPGMSHSKRIGSAPHTLGSEQDPHEDAANQFSKVLSEKLMSKWLLTKGAEFQVVAEPRFLGKLKKEIKKTFHKSIEWVGKDLMKVPKKNWPKLLGYKLNKKNIYQHSNRSLSS